MTTSFSGNPSVVLPATSRDLGHQSPKSSDSLNLQAVKSTFVAALSSTRGQQSAAELIEDATFSLIGDTIEIQTSLSKVMLPILLNAETERILNAALHEREPGKFKIKLIAHPRTAKGAARGAEEPQFVSGSNSEAKAISAPFRKLIETAAKLNKVSDQLTFQIAEIDAALKRLNLGVSAWVTIEDNCDEDGNWLREELGYTRIGSRWGIALRTSAGMQGDPSSPDTSFSAFSDAPRQLRMRAVQQIPRLIERLSKEAEDMIAKLLPKVDEITDLTRALQALGGGER